MARMRGDIEIRDALGRRWENVIGSAIEPVSVPAVLPLHLGLVKHPAATVTVEGAGELARLLAGR